MPFVPDYDVPSERRPYALDRSEVGILMLHGFMGSPLSSRPLAEYLADQGITVHCPLLPGHGHWPDKLVLGSQEAWLAEAEEALEKLRQKCRVRFLMGHSMGNALAAHLAVKADDLRGMIALAPIFDVPDWRLKLLRFVRRAVPWLYPHRLSKMQHLVRERILDFDPAFEFETAGAEELVRRMSRMPTYALEEMRRTVALGRRLYPRLRVPILIIDGDRDIAVSPESGRHVYEAVASEDKTYHGFQGAGHELMRPADPAHQRVWSLVAEFVWRQVEPIRRGDDLGVGLPEQPGAARQAEEAGVELDFSD